MPSVPVEPSSKGRRDYYQEANSNQTRDRYRGNGPPYYKLELYDGDNPKSLLVSNVETWTEATMDGTDYRFSCITKCPCCGYKSQFSDGSL